MSDIRYARNGFNPEPYPCVYPWPEDCGVQGRDKIHLERKGKVLSAFFEAFPRNPNTYLRGEGESIQEAEEQCWRWYQKILECPSHDFERRGYTNGLGFCKHCNLSATVFEPSEVCTVCGINTFYGQDKENRWYCEEHFKSMPRVLWSRTREMVEEINLEDAMGTSDEDIQASIKDVLEALADKGEEK